MLKSLKVKMVENSTTTASTGLSSGSVMCQKRAPGAGAVGLGRLVELLGDRDQPGQDRDGEERQPAPDVDHDHRGHRVVLLAEPVGPGRIHEPSAMPVQFTTL